LTVVGFLGTGAAPPARSRCNSPHSPESLLATTHDCATAFFLEFSCGKEEEEEGKKKDITIETVES
jgi:hypothetical protein